MELNNIKILVNKYFDGNTSCEEDIEIANYLLTNDNIPDDLTEVKLMFEVMGLLKREKAPMKSHKQSAKLGSRIVWMVAAVACIILCIVTISIQEIYNIQSQEPYIICHVNGVKVDDPEIAEQEARRILGNINSNVNLAMASIEKVNILKTN